MALRGFPGSTVEVLSGHPEAPSQQHDELVQRRRQMFGPRAVQDDQPPSRDESARSPLDHAIVLGDVAEDAACQDAINARGKLVRDDVRFDQLDVAPP